MAVRTKGYALGFAKQMKEVKIILTNKSNEKGGDLECQK